jgi:hypothetical protein
MAHEGLWQQLVRLDQEETANRAKCRYLSDRNSYIMTFLNTEFIVDLSNKQIFSVLPDSSKQPANFLQQLCLLAYLINAQDMPLASKLVQGQFLPGGQFFFRGVHGIPAEKLEKAFGSHPEALYRNIEQFNAKRCEFGDASIQFNILPRIPLAIVIWKGDEEFEARASVLFDRTAANHIPLDALLAAVNLAIDALATSAGLDA